MRKLTKTQKEIEALSKRLPQPSEAFRKWDLRLREKRNFSDTDMVWESYYSMVGRFCVERIFDVGKDYCDEIAQWWTDTDKGVTYYRERHSSLIYGGNYGYRFQGYDPSTPFTFKPKSGIVDKYGYQFVVPFTRGRARITKELARKGATAELMDKFGVRKLSKALADTRMETILKHSKKDFLYFMDNHMLTDEIWTAYKITIRHKYTIRNMTTWYDMICLLVRCGMDIHNPKFVCAKATKKLHDELVERHQRILERQRREQERAKIEQELKKMKDQEDKFKERMQMYFGLCIVTDGGITITPLKSVQEFYEEGEAMHHCVYSCGYYAKDGFLVLSAKDKDGNRLETIEVNLHTMKVEQSRGVCNKPTKSHRDILKAMEDNMWQIDTIAHPRRHRIAC